MSESIVDKLYAALEAVEWIYENNWYNGEFCPWCEGEKPEHKSDCQRQAALAETDEIRKRWDQQLCRDIATGE